MNHIKYLILLFSLTAFIKTPVFPFENSREDEPATYAVVVGISSYSDPNIIPLKFAHKDAESYRNFLLSPAGGSVPPQNIVLLTNEKATRSTIIGSLRKLFQRVTDNDVIIFYYAGHGIPDPKIPRELYFATYDTDDENYAGTALLKGQVETEFVSSQAKLKLFLADACHSGGTGIYLGTRADGAERINQLAKNISSITEPGWAALTAASGAELSMEDAKWGGGHGVFTYYLIKGLEGEADKSSKKNSKAKGDGNGIVTVREIHEYLNNVIPSETNGTQHPDKQGLNEDIFPVSAVTPDLYTRAVEKYVKPGAQSQTLATDVNAAPVLKPNLETATLDMDPGKCKEGLDVFGELYFINNYKEDVLLYFYNNGGFKKPNLLIAKGEKVSMGRIMTGFSNPSITSKDFKFFFRTVDESKAIRYGVLMINVESCKVKTFVLTNNNLYLSANGEKKDI